MEATTYIKEINLWLKGGGRNFPLLSEEGEAMCSEFARKANLFEEKVKELNLQPVEMEDWETEKWGTNGAFAVKLLKLKTHLTFTHKGGGYSVRKPALVELLDLVGRKPVSFKKDLFGRPFEGTSKWDVGLTSRQLEKLVVLDLLGNSPDWDRWREADWETLKLLCLTYVKGN
jgi:hypothetical protein